MKKTDKCVMLRLDFEDLKQMFEEQFPDLSKDYSIGSWDVVKRDQGWEHRIYIQLYKNEDSEREFVKDRKVR